MFCKKCGNKLNSHDKFCSNCGEPVVHEAEEPAIMVPEPPKDLVWNVEGYPTDKKDEKVEEVIFDWKADNQGEDFAVDAFYVDERQNISAQRLLDKEVEKINSYTQAREEAILKSQAQTGKQTDFFSPVTERPVELEGTVDAEEPLDSEEPEELKAFYLDAEELELSDVEVPEETDESVPPVLTSVVENPNPANKTELKYEDIFAEEEKEEEKPKGFTIGKFILVIVIILLLAEGAYLGLSYYIPENPTVKMVNDKVTQAVLTVESWFEAKEPVKELTEEPEPVDIPKKEDPIKENPVKEEPDNPYPDNVNIKEITSNPDLKYVPGRDYGNVDVNKSLPATENTDQVLKTVVGYDSKWIDYVNNGDKGILALIASGSPAEKNTLAFTKVGVIKETFKSLQIGEVRKGVKGYYVWVREEIQIEENNTNTTKIYNWIYQVAPVENVMKIVDYFSYK